jgi:hypothetical protein
MSQHVPQQNDGQKVVQKADGDGDSRNPKQGVEVTKVTEVTVGSILDAERADQIRRLVFLLGVMGIAVGQARPNRRTSPKGTRRHSSFDRT